MKRMSKWVTRGFEGFSQGTMGNAGHNMYVSRAGVLQRIHQYDFDRDGYFDLVFCNSQDHYERQPTYVYVDPLGDLSQSELPAEGAMTGLLADLNGDGYDELIIGMGDNGIRRDLNAVIYFGSVEGFSEGRQLQLPAPMCSAVAAGDFNGNGRVDVAFLCRPGLEPGRRNGTLRVFYRSHLGHEPRRYVDLDIAGHQMAAADLDGDGFADLMIRDLDGGVRVYWGGPEGIEPGHFSAVPVELDPPRPEPEDDLSAYAEWVEDAIPLAQVITLGGKAYLFVPRHSSVFLVPGESGRQFGTPVVLDCPGALAAAAGDINGDGIDDLELACRGTECEDERSWTYWGSGSPWDSRKCQGLARDPTPLPTDHANDIAVADPDGDGRAEVIVCQGHTADSFTSESLIYRLTPDGPSAEPIRLLTHDARRVFVTGRGDARPQIVFVNHYARNLLGNVDAYIYPGGPDGFSPERRLPVAGWGAVEAVCCDLNDDGILDLVLANASENSVWRDPGSYLFLGGPDGLPHWPSLVLPTQRAHCVCCADLNRDGYLDLAFCGFDNPDLTVYYGSAQGFDLEHPARIRLAYEGVTYKEPRWMYLADLNNDGWLDLFVPDIVSDRSLVLWGGPEGFGTERCQALSVERAACARAADLSGNGYLDLIVGGHTPTVGQPNDSFVYIYWNGPEGLQQDNRALLPAAGINALAVADFNNSGLLDIFICSYHSGRERDIDSFIYWNRPGGGFSAEDRQRLFTHSASGCVAADFNEDGWIDLAIAYHKVEGDHKGYSAVWWNGPEGLSEHRTTTLPTSGPHGMVAVGPGSIVDRGPEEYYTSAPFQLPAGSRVRGISWTAEVPAKTWVRAQLRSAATMAGLEDAAWAGPDGPGSWYESGQEVRGDATGAWIQYRLALGATNSLNTPRVIEVAVDYM